MAISVEDHVAIQRLMYDYARCADSKDYPGFARVFTPDAEFDFSGRVASGLEEIREMMLALEKYTVTQHQVHNVLYEVDGEAASGETYCTASHLLPVDGQTQKIDMAITYRDRLRRTAEGWRIHQRQFVLLWSQRSVLAGY